jgi:cation:H+ antiporter
MFEEVGLIGNVLILLASMIILERASDLTINNAVAVADTTGFGRASTGFILVAFCTSLSSLSVSLFSAVGLNTHDVAIGNALGSNIVNIALILGISLLLATLKERNHTNLIPSMTREEIGNLNFGLFIASIIPLALIYIGYASAFIGILLLAIFTVYTVWLSRKRIANGAWPLSSERRKVKWFVLITLLGALIVVATAFFVINSASNIATTLGVPAIVMGSTVVAFGTSLPVLVAAISCVRKGHLDVALGSIIGSCFMNTTLILGIPLLASSIRVDIVSTFTRLVTFSVITSLFLWYFLSNERTSWREGALLIVLYAVFLATTLNG